MTVVYCADRNLYPYLPTAINSLLQNNPQVKKIYLLIEDDNIPYINHSKIEFINCNNFDFLIRENINCTERFPYMTMVRCFLTKILKEDKVIYLDVDTIVNRNLELLWNLNLGNRFYIAGALESENYINSGVLLLDLKAIKTNGLDDKMIYLLNNFSFQFPDQDAINITFRNLIYFISPLQFNNMKFQYDSYTLIYHFLGEDKPWLTKDLDSFKKRIWNKYYVKEIKEN